MAIEIAWLSVSMAYMLSSIYFQLRYREWLPKAIPAALFTFGSGIFIATNNSQIFRDVADPLWLEITVMLFLSLGWIFAIFSVRAYTELRKEVGLSISDEWEERRNGGE